MIMLINRICRGSHEAAGVGGAAHTGSLCAIGTISDHSFRVDGENKAEQVSNGRWARSVGGARAHISRGDAHRSRAKKGWTHNGAKACVKIGALVW